MISSQSYGRIGFIGNPSDGFNGKTISFSLKNFSANVFLQENDKLEIVHNADDRSTFNDIYELREDVLNHGYYGCIRLIKATIKKFSDICIEKNIPLNKNFRILYNTSIPRQVGLGGSSAIVASTFKALQEFYNTKNFIQKELLPQVYLDIEQEELGIKAGLQDRVIQVYPGLVYMDFTKEAFAQNNNLYGNYKKLDYSLPNMFLAFSKTRKTESGKAHNEIRMKHQQGDKHIIDKMNQIALLTDKALQALQTNNIVLLKQLINQNFDLRREVYGDEIIGRENLRLIQIARDIGHCSKLTGSGGAVFGIYNSEQEFNNLEHAYKSEGFNITKVII